MPRLDGATPEAGRAASDDAYASCTCCPRQCGVDRSAGQTGYCGETAVCRVASAGPHFGEEPPISGTRGSGTLFFTGCSCRCFFCQNVQISTGGLGTAYEVEGLLALAEGLVAQGVHNLNFVTPDHVWLTLERMLGLLRARGHTLPFVFNSSGYHLPEQVDRYAELVEIFLPDFKFADANLARTVMGDAAYPDLALASLRRMVEHRGFLEPWDTTGQRTAARGVLVRHLVLPGAVENSLSVLRCLRKEFGRYLPLSIMSQYHPMPACADRGDFARPLLASEYACVTEEVEALGFENVFVQDAYGEEAFLPDFTKDHPFQGNRRPLPNAASR